MSGYIPTYAVVPSDGRALLAGCLRSLRAQVQGIVIVANGGYAPDEVPYTAITVVQDPGQDRNISRWWNLGLAAVAERNTYPRWNVLVVNDDIVAPPHLAETLASAMRSTTAVLAYPNQHDNLGTVWTRAEPVNLFHRITGYAHMHRGETGLRLDESLAWWYGDDDVDWRAREAGGAALVPGCAVEHRAPNGYTNAHPELGVQAGLDRQAFREKWGRTPW